MTTSVTTGRIRLGILGCGAITRSQHLPAAIGNPAIAVTALVDSDAPRAKALAASVGLACTVTNDYRDVLPQVDAILNALPNHLHAPVTLEALRRGVHVLCEKPLATKSADAQACADSAAKEDLVLAVGMNRRFVGSHPLLHSILQSGMLGELQNYDCQYGGEWDWKSASGFYLSRAQAGGGALIDFGVHLLDGLIDWFGPVKEFEYQDDNWGSGIEANAILDLKHEGSYGPITGRMRVSRTLPLKNRTLVHGSEASAEINLSDADAVVVQRSLIGQAVNETMRLEGWANTSSFAKQLENFVNAIRKLEKPAVDGTEAARVLRLVEDCYANANRIPEPWSEVSSRASEVKA